MDKTEKNFVTGLENEVRTLQDQIRYWQDPRVAGLQDISGSKMSAKEIVVALEARIREILELVKSISK